MRRDCLQIVVALLISSGVAAAANVGWHKMEWLRAPLDAPGDSSDVTTTQPVPGGERRNGVGHGDAHKDETIGYEVVLQHLREGTASFIDARSPEEYAEAHFRGALNLPSNAIYENIDEVTGQVLPDDLVIVYCGGGGCEASVNVSDALRRYYQYTRVVIYENGWEEIETMLDEFSDCLEVESGQ
ncbi:MAG: rhodanese-like domain-containing protein [Planctomycetota bacterium]